jgi:hypothetical protein
VTYTVMDDLKVAPMSTISGITLLNTFGITDIGLLEEKTVQLGYAEVMYFTPEHSVCPLILSLTDKKIIHVDHVSLQGLEILRASLQSKTVLSDVFLGNKKQNV